MNIRSIEEINRKIQRGEATVLTAEEVSNLVREGKEPKAEDIDVITTGTCGVMSGTAAIFHVKAGEPGSFKKAKKVFLNGVPGFPGPCPNEWLGSVDMVIYGTSHSVYDDGYGGGFLFNDIISGNEIEIEVESINGNKIKSTIDMNDFGTARMIGTRLAFKNYTAFINPSPKPAVSIFHVIEMDGPYKGLSFSGCGELNPLQNDPVMNTLKKGTKILMCGAEGMIIGNGTRSTLLKPNLMISADMYNMDPHFIGGFRTAAGPEIYNSVAAAIPVLNDEILENTYIINKDIELPIADIKGRHLPLGTTNYAEVWENTDERPLRIVENCMHCDECIVRERCPTGAYSGTFNLKMCFGCGMCAYSCPYGAFDMKRGEIKFKQGDTVIDIPIVCRQSDIKRARELAAELKKRIMEGKFLISRC